MVQRYQLRQEKVRPILEDFKLWLDETDEKLTNKSYIATAVKYNLNQWEKQIRYIEDGELGIDNNITERNTRPFTTGRKIGCSVTPLKAPRRARCFIVS